MDDYLAKPIHASTLIAMINKYRAEPEIGFANARRDIIGIVGRLPFGLLFSSLAQAPARWHPHPTRRTRKTMLSRGNSVSAERAALLWVSRRRRCPPCIRWRS